uniref:Putative secreted peptide n=1 Tax=Hyalomma excavatum TaxID=257692 RepID=A0A131XLU7_9ACAR
MAYLRCLGLIVFVIVLAIITGSAYGQKDGSVRSKPTKPALTRAPGRSKSTKPVLLARGPARSKPTKPVLLARVPRVAIPRPSGPVPVVQMPRGPWKGVYIVYPPIDLRMAPTKVRWDTL